MKRKIDLLKVKKNIFIALYLPQFYQTNENDKFWYPKFTDWDNVKKAKPLFNGQNQPRIPLKENYYDLSKQKNIDWQIKLADKYGINGFCFYHYQFDYNKHYLSKPIERFINSKYKINFCLCWVNVNWLKTWTGTNEILEKQKYNQKFLKNLLLYFIKKSNNNLYYRFNKKPIFIIYNINDVPEYFLEKIKKYFSIFAIERIDILENKKKFIDKIIDWSLNRIKIQLKDNNNLKIIDYKNVCQLTKEHINNKIPTILLEFDNTSRFNKKGIVFKNFKNIYLDRLIKFCLKKSKINFINAWNEWAEGIYLEPDIKRKYKLLEIFNKYEKNS